jgi:Xaa-Pro dipeptidase
MSAERLDRFAASIEAAGFAAAVVSYHRDVFYLAGTAQPCNLLVVPGAEPVLFSRRYIERARSETWVADVVEASGLGPIRESLEARGVRGGRVGMTLDIMPANLYKKAVVTLGAYAIEDVSGILAMQRAVKDAGEIEALRRAAAIFGAAHGAIIEHARPGASELEVAAEVVGALRRAGHDGLVFTRRWDAMLQPEGGVASGENLWTLSALAIAVTGTGLDRAVPFGASRRVLEEGDLLNIDLGLCVAGYHGDMARTYSLGEPSEAIARFSAIVRACEDAAFDAIAPGVEAQVPYAAALEVARSSGVEQWFQGHGRYHGPYIGHSIGLELDEEPVLGPGATVLLEEGMVLTIEPKLMVPGVGAVNLEDDVVVGSAGNEYLNGLPRDLFVIADGIGEPYGAPLG